MQINSKEYKIDGLEIEWSKPLNEVRALVYEFEKFESYGGWPKIRCKCSEIFGLATTEADIRAPFEDRPVLQVQYSITPIKHGFLEKPHTPYLKQLEKFLGKPFKSESAYSQPDLKKEYLYSAVVFSAKWLFDDIRISLSVYGGIRKSDSGFCAAGIFLDWIDEIKAAKPFREKIELFEQSISVHINNNIVIDRFKLKQKQRPFTVIHYELKDPYIAEKDNNLRVSQMSLYKRDLLQTPKIIQNQLNEEEIALYKVSELNMLFVSNKWDTIYLNMSKEEEERLIFYEILPARGSGGREIELKDLKIEDSRNSNSLIQLVEKIESETGLKIQRKERYDD